MKKELKKRYNNVRENIKNAALNAGRDPGDIKLIPISKTHSTGKINYFYENEGITTFGESRVQELRKKNNNLSDVNVSWHFVGHLQRNKVKYLLRMEKCKMIQSLDSWRLAREIDKRAKKNERVMPVLIEVNVSRDENKYGISPDNILEFVNKVVDLDNIQVEGLMTLAPYKKDPEETRPYFRELANLKSLIKKNGINLKELSMGMSNDYQIAIEEGATMLRIGSAIFGERNY